jgi:hypothetical protein
MKMKTNVKAGAASVIAIAAGAVSFNNSGGTATSTNSGTVNIS